MRNVLTLAYLCVACSMAAYVQQGLPASPSEKVCSGTNMGFSYSGSLRRHFRNMRRRYSGCTYVQGNLEITHLRHKNIDYNLSFLRSIRYVSGYIIIAMVTRVKEIPLTNLEVIRGNKTMDILGKDFSLVVTLTSKSRGSRRGLQELQMPNLREISSGKVLFADNPGLCYLDTILWDAVIRDGTLPVLHGKQALSHQCLPCSQRCHANGKRRCWGRGKSMCQTVTKLECHPSCPHRCFGPGHEGCCHAHCSVGCYGPEVTDCELCKDFNHRGRCVAWCPFEDNTYALGTKCFKF